MKAYRGWSGSNRREGETPYFLTASKVKKASAKSWNMYLPKQEECPLALYFAFIG